VRLLCVVLGRARNLRQCVGRTALEMPPYGTILICIKIDCHQTKRWPRQRVAAAILKEAAASPAHKVGFRNPDCAETNTIAHSQMVHER
jgi:hypothetical protein